jgi:hypothetical protein
MARKKKGHATILLLVGNRETTHRGPTLQAALRTAERSRLSKSCTIRWGRTFRLPSRRTAGGNGRVFCEGRYTGRDAYWMGVRTNPKGWRRGRP